MRHYRAVFPACVSDGSALASFTHRPGLLLGLAAAAATAVPWVAAASGVAKRGRTRRSLSFKKPPGAFVTFLSLQSSTDSYRKRRCSRITSCKFLGRAPRRAFNLQHQGAGPPYRPQSHFVAGAPSRRGDGNQGSSSHLHLLVRRRLNNAGVLRSVMASFATNLDLASVAVEYYRKCGNLQGLCQD